MRAMVMMGVMMNVTFMTRAVCGREARTVPSMMLMTRWCRAKMMNVLVIHFLITISLTNDSRRHQIIDNQERDEP